MAAIKRKVKQRLRVDRPNRPGVRKIRDNATTEGRWEIFALNVAKGVSHGDAYAAAGYHDKSGAGAAKLMRKPEVAARISELRAQIRARMKITVETIVMDLQEDRAFAYRCANPAAAITATMAIAKLLGLLVDKSELSVVMKPALAPTDRREMTIEEWQAQWAPKALPPPNGHA